VRINIADIIRRQLGVFQRSLHHAIGAVTVFRRLGDVIRVPGHAVADNFRKNLSIALLRVFQRLKNQNAGALADHKTITMRIKGAASMLRIIIACLECFHGREAADTHRSDGSLGAAANHHFSRAALDDFE